MSVWIPTELAETVREQLPEVNVSGTLQKALRGLLGCEHKTVVCADCAEPVQVAGLIDLALSAYFSQLMMELEDLMVADGTVEGACQVAKKVGIAHGISKAQNQPLRRPAGKRRLPTRREWREIQAERAQEGLDVHARSSAF
jgi:hypothetical protein